VARSCAPWPLASQQSSVQKHTLLSLVAALTFSAPGSLAASGRALPAFVETLIQQYEAGSRRNSPGSIWKYEYRGAQVFYVPPLYCCDLPSRLYDAEGSVICSPDGGIAGAGDGRCPDFFARRRGELLLWKDQRPEDRK
jgi:hypothetical protein